LIANSPRRNAMSKPLIR